MQSESCAVFNNFFKKQNNIFGNHVILFTEGMKMQWEKGGNNLLLGDGTGGSWPCWNQSGCSARLWISTGHPCTYRYSNPTCAKFNLCHTVPDINVA